MFAWYNTLSDMHKGILWMAIGTVLLLHTLGMLTALLKWFLIGASLWMIACGSIRSGLSAKVTKMFKKQQ